MPARKCAGSHPSHVNIAIILPALKMPPNEFGKELRLVAAVKLFELGKLSSGAAARLAGIP